MKKLLSFSVLALLTVVISGCQKRTEPISDTIMFKNKIGKENTEYEAAQRELEDINNDYQDLRSQREKEEAGITEIDEQSSLMGDALDAKFKLSKEDEINPLPQTIVKDGSFAHSGFNFSIDYPKSWTASRNILGSVLMITSPQKNEDDNFAENISVFVENVPSIYEDQTIDDYMKKALEEMKKGINQFKLLEQQDISLHGEKAKAYSYSMVNKDDKELQMMLVATIYSHRVYGITYGATKDKYKNILPIYKKSLKSFKFLSKLKK